MTTQTEMQLLDKWFGKLLTQMPQALREQVERYIPDWDKRSGIEQRAAATEIDRERAISDWVVTDALRKLFDKPLHKLPPELRINIKKHIPQWADLSVSERRSAAKNIDLQRATKLRIRLDRMNRTPSAEEAAEFKHAWETEEWSAPDAAPASPFERRAKIDITRERGARRRVIENWANIEKLHGQRPDAHHVLRYLKMDKDETQPKLKTIQNILSALRGERLIP